MERAITWIYLALLSVALQIIVLRVCRRHAAMWQWRNFLRLAAIAWCLMAVGKELYLNELIPPADAVEHELVARDIADLVRESRFREAASYFAVGNDAYRVLLGMFYAATGASEVVTYAVNGAFGFVGLLILLDVLCRHTQCPRLPTSVVATTALLPSGILWTTTNLKEGIVLWGICSMLYFTVPERAAGARPPRRWPVLGLLTVTLLRPHIAAAWLTAIAAGTMLGAKRFGTFCTMSVAGVLLLFVLNTYIPELIERAVGEGITTTLSDRYSTLSTRSAQNGAALTGSKPTPIVSGLGLIMFRPWPNEVEELPDLLVGLEVWTLALLGLLNWRTVHGRLRLLLRPALVTQVVALLALGFFFSYMYNMGLVVRQRLMCFPAMLFLYFYPMLAQDRNRRGAVVRTTSPFSLRSRPGLASVFPARSAARTVMRSDQS